MVVKDFPIKLVILPMVKIKNKISIYRKILTASNKKSSKKENKKRTINPNSKFTDPTLMTHLHLISTQCFTKTFSKLLEPKHRLILGQSFIKL